MSLKFFKLDHVQIMSDTETGKIYIFLKDNWVEVEDSPTRKMIQLEALELNCE